MSVATGPTSSTARFVARREDVRAPLTAAALLADAAPGEPVFYLAHPDSGEATVAIGAVCELVTSGARRFADAAAEARELLDSVVESSAASASDDAVLPRLVGGFSFADKLESSLWRDFAPCRLVLPRTQWILAGGRWVRFDVAPLGRATPAPTPTTARGLVARARSRAVAHCADESRDSWVGRARAVIAAIGEGRFEKVVLARCESRALSGDVEVAALLEELGAGRPSCYTFCVAAGESVFVGSSPEQLVGVLDGEIEADALAGTIARGAAGSEDRARAAALLASEKDLREHAVVVDALRASLAPFVRELNAAEKPTTRAFPEGHHLHTSLRGKRTSAASVLEVVGAVHPTPAVCGAPRSSTKALLADAEPHRGWYAGGIGWVDRRGEGRFAVALRAGLFDRGRLSAWAGAGLVAGSDPERECAETTLKMQALLGAMGKRIA